MHSKRIYLSVASELGREFALEGFRLAIGKGNHDGIAFHRLHESGTEMGQLNLVSRLKRCFSEEAARGSGVRAGLVTVRRSNQRVCGTRPCFTFGQESFE
jgi:hypothetical protein